MHPIILALAITLNGMQLQPLPATVRVGTAVDMAWQVTDTDGSTWQQRIAITGCVDGYGQLTLIEDDGTPTSGDEPSLPWTRSGALGDLATTICKAGGQS